MNDAEIAVTSAVTAGPGPAINQMYRECLAALFKRDYYQEMYNRTIRYAKVFDYSIGLGSAASGGTGLGILANPQFGWLCGAMTTVSVVLSIAKGVWDWSGKSKFALDRTYFYSKLYAGYNLLVDDVNAHREWNKSFSERRDALRGASLPDSPDPYPEMELQVRKQIQDNIKAKLDYRKWWMWT
jgi:hypothetical protein